MLIAQSLLWILLFVSQFLHLSAINVKINLTCYTKSFNDGSHNRKLIQILMTFSKDFLLIYLQKLSCCLRIKVYSSWAVRSTDVNQNKFSYGYLLFCSSVMATEDDVLHSVFILISAIYNLELKLKSWYTRGLLKSDIGRHSKRWPPKFEIAREIPQLKISFWDERLSQ